MFHVIKKQRDLLRLDLRFWGQLTKVCGNVCHQIFIKDDKDMISHQILPEIYMINYSADCNFLQKS